MNAHTSTSTGTDTANTEAGTPQQRELPKHPVVRLVGSAVGLTIALCLIGFVIVDLLTPSALTRWEDSVNQGAVDRRTPTMDSVSAVGSRLSDTVTCIALLIVMALVLRWWLGRWRESIVLTVAIVGELLIFLVVTFVVHRDRPDVPKLDAAPPTSSFPSGHTAAAVAIYGCIAFIVWRRMSNRTLAGAIVALCCLVPVAVGASRLYRGMHHPTDVLFGAIGGGVWLLVVVSTLLPPRSAPSSTDRATSPELVPSEASGT
jgi:undecaprenyl-diphosphatase